MRYEVDHDQGPESRRVPRDERRATHTDPARPREALVPAPIPVRDRPAGDPERDAQGPTRDRADHDRAAAAGTGQATKGSEGRETWLTRNPPPSGISGARSSAWSAGTR